MAENLRLAGRSVTLVQSAPHILRAFDFGMAQILQKEMLDKGVELIVGDALVGLTATQAILASGKR